MNGCPQSFIKGYGLYELLNIAFHYVLLVPFWNFSFWQLFPITYKIFMILETIGFILSILKDKKLWKIVEGSEIRPGKAKESQCLTYMHKKHLSYFFSTWARTLNVSFKIVRVLNKLGIYYWHIWCQTPQFHISSCTIRFYSVLWSVEEQSVNIQIGSQSLNA